MQNVSWDSSTQQARLAAEVLFEVAVHALAITSHPKQLTTTPQSGTSPEEVNRMAQANFDGVLTHLQEQLTK